MEMVTGEEGTWMRGTVWGKGDEGSNLLTTELGGVMGPPSPTPVYGSGAQRWRGHPPASTVARQGWAGLPPLSVMPVEYPGRQNWGRAGLAAEARSQQGLGCEEWLEEQLPSVSPGHSLH